MKHVLIVLTLVFATLWSTGVQTRSKTTNNPPTTSTTPTPAAASPSKTPARSLKNTLPGSELARQQLYLDSFDFFESEEDHPLFLKLSQMAIEQEIREPAVHIRVAQYHLKNKDRSSLVDFIKSASQKFDCKAENSSKQSPCRELSQIWERNLDSMFFFEDSAPKAERLRRLLEAKDCSSAHAVLKELQAREGTLRQLVESELKVAECLADIVFQDQVRQRLEELRFFSSEL